MGQAFLYGTGGGGTGGTLTVTAPAGVIVTISKDGKTKTKTADENGVAVFKGLKTGTWTVVITDGPQISPTRQVVVTADYDVTMNFFSATIVVTYPEGSTCTCSDGKTVLTAPDTSGICTFTVNNAGEWTVKAVSGSDSASESVSITTDGQSESVTLDYTLVVLDSSGWNTTKTGEFSKTGGTGTVSVQTAALELYTESTSGVNNRVRTFASHKNAIDFTPYKKLTVKYSETSGNNNQNIELIAGVSGDKTTATTAETYTAYAKVIDSASAATAGTFEIDITNVNAVGYICFTHGSNYIAKLTTYINEIKLE